VLSVKIRGGLLLASLLFCVAFAPAAHAASAVRLAQAAPAQPAAPVPAPAPTDQPAQPSADPAQPADPSQPADADEPVGNVATLKGTATVTRNGTVTPLKLQDDIYKGDELQTGKNATLGVTFTDDTTLNLSASSRVVVDNFVYQDNGKDNAALINVTRGTMAFVAAAVAKTGDMKIETPTATLGIRGTTGVVEVPEGAAANAANNVGVKLYPDADGKVGRIEVKARDGAPLGMLTQGASGFTVRGVMVRGFGMRMSAMPMVMSAQMIARDRGFVQRVHTMQGIGRNIVMQQRNFRLQNPRQPGFGRPGLNQPGQRGGLNQPGQRGGFNQPGQRGQPGLNNRPGQFNQPGLRNQPGQPNRPGLNQPGLQNPPGQRGGLQPGTGRPGLPNQPGMQRPPGAPNQFGQRPGLNQPGMQRPPGVQQGMRQGLPGPSGLPRQTGVPGSSGMPGGFQRPSGIPAIQGGASGILNRLGVPGVAGRAGIPQVPTQRMPSTVPRAGQALPSAQKKLPQLPKRKDLPKDIR